MKRKLQSLLAIALLMFVALLAGYAFTPHNNIKAAVFKSWQSNFDTRIRVVQGEYRQVELQPDGVTKKFASVDMPDGTIQNFWYGAKGKLSEAKTFSVPVNGIRILIRHSLFDENGEDYLSDIEFSSDGSGEVLRRTTMILPLLSYRWTYRPGTNGQVWKFEAFNRDVPLSTAWKKLLADEFTPQMALAETFRRTKEGFERIKYGQDHSVVARQVLIQKMYKETWFYQGTDKTRLFVEQSSDGTTIKTFDLEGNIEQEHQAFGAIGTTPWYSVLGSKNSPRHNDQRWMPATKEKPAMLLNATAYENGFAIVKAEYDEKTGRLKQVTQYLDGNGFKGADYIFHVREDGFLAKRVHRDPKGTVIGELVYKPSENVELPVVLPADMLAIFQFDYLPPQVVEYAPGGR